MKLEGKRIYVGDDDENVRDAVATILEDEGATVIGGGGRQGHLHLHLLWQAGLHRHGSLHAQFGRL